MKLSYLQQGFGTELPLILLHPYPLNAYFWRDQLAAFSKNRHVVAPHFRGYGTSDIVNEGPFTVETFATDIRNTLAHLEIKQAVFAGVSMGGYVLFELWRQDPELIAGMILADTRAEADSEEARTKRMQTIDKFRAAGIADLPETAVGMISPSSRKANPQLEADIKDWAAQADCEVIVRTLEMLAARPDSRPTLGTINVPCLVIVGADDQITPPEAAKVITDGIPNSSLVAIPDAGHFSPMEQSVLVNSAISDFLEKISS